MTNEVEMSPARYIKWLKTGLPKSANPKPHKIVKHKVIKRKAVKTSVSADDWDTLNRKKDPTYSHLASYKNIPGIYKITNTTNGMFYIGSSNRVRNRLLGHLWKLRKGKHPIHSLQKDFSAFGMGLFTFEVLEIVHEENLLEKEGFWYACHERTLSYNLANIPPRSFLKFSQNTTVVCPVIFEEQAKKFIKSLKDEFYKECEGGND